MKRHQIAAGLFSCLAFFSASTGPANAHHGSFQVCNNSDDIYYVSLVYRTGLGILSSVWTARGHYQINAGTCENIWRPFANIAQIHVGIKKKGWIWGKADVAFKKGQFRGSGLTASAQARYFCTSQKAFRKKGSLTSLSACGGESKKQLFSLYLHIPAVAVGTNRRNILHLN